jgi:hypothetical protein
MEGEVAALAHKKLALRRAAAVPGVARIVDRVHIAPRATMSDGEIRARLREIFRKIRTSAISTCARTRPPA